jgi:uncharacterized protein (TIGR00369 family)
VPDLPEWAAYFASELDRKMGLELLEVTPQRAVGRYPVKGNTQPEGIWHGGASAVVVETLASLAGYAEVGGTGHAFGAEVSVSHLSPASEGWVEGVAEAVRIGGTLAVYNVTLTNNGKLIAVGRATVALKRPKESS